MLLTPSGIGPASAGILSFAVYAWHVGWTLLNLVSSAFILKNPPFAVLTLHFNPTLAGMSVRKWLALQDPLQDRAKSRHDLVF